MNKQSAENEFIKRFEKELEEDNLEGFLEEFDQSFIDDEGDFGLGLLEDAEMEDDPLGIFSEAVPDSFSIEGVDLGDLLNEATSAGMPAEPVATVEPGNSVEDMFADIFGADAVNESVNDMPIGDASEGIDLSNLGEADLMSLLAGEDGLSDIGNLLSADTPADLGEMDAFSLFAEGEMEAQTKETEEADTGKADKKEKKKKDKGEKSGGFFAKLMNLLFGDDEEEATEVSVNRPAAPTPEQLSGENAEILAAFDDIESRPDAQKKEKKKKDKKKKEEKDKKKKEKKEKKEKKPKKEKPKKEKKPKEVDNTPPLPKGPVIMVWIMALSILALVMVGVNLSGYSSAVTAARVYHDNGEYAKAYAELLGLEIKEKDTMLYNQAATLAAVDSELNAFDSFLWAGKHQEALDSLVCAAGRCEVNADNAQMYECEGQMEILKAEVTNKLFTYYGMTYEEAMELYEMDRDDYSIALVKKLRSLGLVE